MSMTDPIADLLTRIRNGLHARHATVEMPSSTLKTAVAGVLRDEGYVKDVSVSGEAPKKRLRIELAYSEKNRPIITGIRRISRPGLRVYRGAREIPRVAGGLGVAVVSTSKGVMSGSSARRQRLGGEVLCEVW